MSVYQRRAVLFMDMLGFKEIVKNGMAEKILSAFALTPKNPSWSGRNVSNVVDFRITNFSDCIVASVAMPSKSNYLPAAILALYAGEVALTLLSIGILTRGAIVAGDLHHDENSVFGPALVHAHELESKVAQYPRIIVHDDVYGKVNMSICVFIGVEWFVDNEPFRKDFDGIKHLDIFGNFFIPVRPLPMLKRRNNEIKTLGYVTTSLVKRICKIRHSDYRVSTKYEWLQHYTEDCCRRFGWKIPRFDRVHGVVRKMSGRRPKTNHKGRRSSADK